MAFTPWFCPNRDCPNHIEDPSRPQWWETFGTFPTRHSGAVPRFICTTCKHTCSVSTFDIQFRTKHRLNLATIAHAICNGEGYRTHARLLGVHHKVIANRISRLSRQALAISAMVRPSICLKEDLAADGLESFIYSQFIPTTFTVLVGTESQYCYCVDASVSRRKGRMTRSQQKLRALLDTRYRWPVRSLVHSFDRILSHMNTLHDRTPERPLVLRTDEHPVYAWRIRTNPRLSAKRESGSFTHQVTSSRLARTLSNPLMSVNYFDREIRKDQANHVRETVQWSKDLCSAMDRMWLYAVMHNIKKCHRINGAQPHLHCEVAGLDTKVVRNVGGLLFKKRLFYSHVEQLLCPSELITWKREWPNPHSLSVAKIWPYLYA
jgi:hypothetical protein